MSNDGTHEHVMTAADQDAATIIKNAIMDLCLRQTKSALVALAAARCAAECFEEIINEQGGEIFTVSSSERRCGESGHDADERLAGVCTAMVNFDGLPHQCEHRCVPDCLGCIASRAGVGRCLVHEPKPSTVTPSEAARERAIAAAATEVFNYTHETDGGHKADFTQGRLIDILSRHFRPTEVTPPAGETRDYDDITAANRWLLGETERLQGERDGLDAAVTVLANELSAARADAIREALERLDQFGRELRKVDAIAAHESLIQQEEAPSPTIPQHSTEQHRREL